MNAKWIGMMIVMSLCWAPTVATACGSYNMSNLCGTIEWIEVVDLGDEMHAIAVHGGFASALAFSFDGLEVAPQVGHGKVIVACVKEDTWCLEGLRSLQNAEVDGGFIMTNAWNGFTAPSSPGVPAGVWLEDAVIGPEIMDPSDPEAFWPHGETSMVLAVEDAAGIPLCRSAAQIGSAIHPGEAIIDFAGPTIRLDKSVPGVDPGFHAVIPVAGPESLGAEDARFDLEPSVDVDGIEARELSSLQGMLESAESSMHPQTGCSESRGSSSPLAILGAALVLLGLGNMGRKEASKRQGL